MHQLTQPMTVFLPGSYQFQCYKTCSGNKDSYLWCSRSDCQTRCVSCWCRIGRNPWACGTAPRGAWGHSVVVFRSARDRLNCRWTGCARTGSPQTNRAPVPVQRRSGWRNGAASRWCSWCTAVRTSCAGSFRIRKCPECLTSGLRCGPDSCTDWCGSAATRTSASTAPEPWRVGSPSPGAPIHRTSNNMIKTISFDRYPIMKHGKRHLLQA